MKRSKKHQASKRSRTNKKRVSQSPSRLAKRVSQSPSRLAKRVLSPSAKIKRRKPKSVPQPLRNRHSLLGDRRSADASKVQKDTSTRVALPIKKSRRNPLRRSYLSKDLSELQLSLHKKRPQAPWISRLASPDRKKSTLLSPERLRKSIKVGHYYRSPRTECKRHGYNQAKCNNDPRCIMSARGCQMATIGVRHVIKK